MVSMTALILPIVVSAVLVFIISALVWMVGPHHKTEWKGVPNEEGTRTAMRGISPGLYMIPWAGSQQARTETAFVKKMAEGPLAYITIARTRSMSMGPMMVQSLIYYLVVSAIVAYVAIHAMPNGASYLHVFQVVGTISWLAYGFGVVPESIWFGRPWSSTFKQIFDALLYALVTAGAFGWRWPR
jgi:hypothetical protein